MATGKQLLPAQLRGRGYVRPYLQVRTVVLHFLDQQMAVLILWACNDRNRNLSGGRSVLPPLRTRMSICFRSSGLPGAGPNLKGLRHEFHIIRRQAGSRQWEPSAVDETRTCPPWRNWQDAGSWREILSSQYYVFVHMILRRSIHSWDTCALAPPGKRAYSSDPNGCKLWISASFLSAMAWKTKARREVFFWAQFSHNRS